MTKIKKNWKIIAIVTSIVGVVVGLVMMFWDKIEDMYNSIRNK